MIDLLPPPLKKHKYFAALNRQLVHLIQAAVVLVLLVAAIFGGSWYYLDHKLTVARADLALAQNKTKTYASIETDAKALADRLTSIEQVQGQQARYTKLLNELTGLMPKGVYIFSLQASSEASSSMRLAVYADTSEAAAALQRAITASPRFQPPALLGEDLDKDPYSGKPVSRVSYVVGLKPGALQ